MLNREQGPDVSVKALTVDGSVPMPWDEATSSGTSRPGLTGCMLVALQRCQSSGVAFDAPVREVLSDQVDDFRNDPACDANDDRDRFGNEAHCQWLATLIRRCEGVDSSRCIVIC